MTDPLICLGIETTAHTFGVGIVDENGTILANVKDSYTTPSGGMIPTKAAEHHLECCDTVIRAACEKANLKVKDVDLIAYSNAPGIGHMLRIGTFAAKTLAHLKKKPLVPVNHSIAHLEIGRKLCKLDDPLLLYASGANTQIITYENGRYRIMGETLDNGVGNFLDSFARALGLGFPGGPLIEQLARNGKQFIDLPYTVKGMDISFGGLLTHIERKIPSVKKEDLCFSVQEHAFAMLLEISERAMAQANKQQLLLGGGVACNKRLQAMAQIMCKEREATCHIPDNQFLVDNGAMIAWTGLLMYRQNKKKAIVPLKKAWINPYERVDQIDVFWR
ncbi:N(6)-L-threonylcarbamoyladenine synthase Kae1 [Candidatus Woesearchaeota archaeon]|nr:N(6)-L-threonylcarbamoyladenine synthase Kae1 [Candidatus Woesearchaeota archaeon]